MVVCLSELAPKVNLGFEERISSSLTGVDFLDGYINKQELEVVQIKWHIL